MKSIGRTIDRILKVDPTLSERLDQIKVKSKKYPSRTTTYWRELLEFLNSDILKKHPKRTEIAGIVAATKSNPKPLYTFDEVVPGDKVLGVVPEHMADFVRRHDIKTIRLAKMQVEANMTRNILLAAKIAREETLLDISVKRMWLQLKDHFDLWQKSSAYSIKNSTLGLVMVEAQQPSSYTKVVGPFGPGDIQNFLRMMGGQPPPEDGQ